LAEFVSRAGRRSTIGPPWRRARAAHR